MSNIIIQDPEIIDLIHSVCEGYVPLNKDQVFTECITGNRNFIPEKDQREYTVSVFLFKAPNPDQYLASLRQLENTIVNFRPNDEVLMTEDGTETKFFIEVVQPYFLDDTDRYDACKLVLKSVDGIKKDVFVRKTGYGYGYGTNYGGGL